MDPNNQPQLTETEQIMLGAQQAAMLQQIHDDEIETKVIQQQHLLNEEKMMEAQQEALAIQQIRQAQELAEQQKEAELHRLQTFAMIKQEQEMMIQQGNQPPPQQPVLQPPGIVTVRMSTPAGTSGLPGLPGAANLQIAPGGPPNLPPSGIRPTGIPPAGIRPAGIPPTGIRPAGMPQAHLPPQGPQPLMGQAPQQSVVFVPPPMSTSSELGSTTTTPPLLQQQGVPRMAGQLSQPGLHVGPPGENPTPLMSIPSQRQQTPQAPPPQRPPAPQTSVPPGGVATEQFQSQSLQRPSEGFRNQGMQNQSLQGPPERFQGPPASKGPPGAPPAALGQGPPQQRMLGAPSGQGPPGVSPFPGQGVPRPQGMSGPPGVQNQAQGPPALHSQGQGAPTQKVLPTQQPVEEEEKPVEKTEEQPAPKTTTAGQSPAGGGPKAAQPNQPPGSREIKLPQALEKVLAFKDVRAQQMGVKPEDVDRVEKGEIIEEDIAEEKTDMGVYQYEQRQPINVYQDAADEDDEEMQPADNQSKKESKNKKRKKKKKRAKAKRAEKQLLPITEDAEDDVDIEYIAEAPEIERTDPSYAEFSRIFQAFKIAEEDKVPDPAEAKKEAPKPVPIKARGLIEDDDSSDDENAAATLDDDKPKLSKKKQKKLNRLSVAELKQLVARPDVVEMHDVTARDPKLLVNIKATRNTVPVPRHWCFKRKYLQGKRGIEKPPFDLPDFIKATGIMEMRQALQEKEDQKTMKSKMRERVRPKMGKIDIDYQKLHDAFFKWQTKPKLSTHGDLYYEGKEFETRLKEKKPGNLTDDLRTALGMPIGPNANNYPPPWLIAMQRYGPPPSYPNLKIPGLNAPIPEACAFGYHAGGWGKPPVDESGKPLYGDVFGTQTTEVETPVQDEDIDRSHWGELESESEEESDEEEDSDEELEDSSGLVTPGDAGLITPSGVTSVPIGVETPDMIELRKKRIEDAMDQGGDTPALYQVLPEKKAAVGGAMMGSAHVYDISAVTAGKKAPDKAGTEGVEVALNPDELDLDTAAMQAKYDQTMREQQSQLEKEDLSDMVAEHAAKQQKKRKKQQQEGKTAKKYKEFKF